MPIQMTNEVKELVGRGDCLSPSLRLTKYAFVKTKPEEDKAKRNKDHNFNKNIIDFICKAKPQEKKTSFEVPNSETLIMKLGARMIINQAGGVLENAGLCIHRFFGFPYIPGSAVKGIARHAAWEEWFYEKKDDANFAKQIADTFGYPTGDKSLDNFLKEEHYDTKKAGSVSFLTATPIGEAKLETDVLTCHHMDYYNGQLEKALDNESPNPQFFPTVAAETSFKFQIVPLRNSQKNKSDICQFAVKYLKLGLEDNGIGAKTASGYGWFEENKSETEKVKKEQEKKDVERKIEAMNPLDRKIAEFSKLADDIFKKHINTLSESDDETKIAVIKCLQTSKIHIWNADKKGKKKAKIRADKMREVANKLGEVLS